MLKCGITGSTGTLGKKVIQNLPFKFYQFKKDITNFNEVQNWVNKNNFDLIIHLAAIVAIKEVKNNNKRAYKVNVDGTKNLVNSLLKKKNKPKWFFYSSSSHVYKLNKKMKLTQENEKAKPQNYYGKTKLIAERYLINKLKNKKISLCIGRIFSFTDKKQKKPFIVPSLIEKIKKNKSKKIQFSNLNHYRDFSSTNHIVKTIYQLFKKKSEGVFNIATGKPIHLEKIAYLLCKKNNKIIKKTKKKVSPTFLIADIKKISRIYNFSKKNFRNNLSYFY